MTKLRRRKRRSNKPLAVMVRSLGDAERLCHIDDAERNLLLVRGAVPGPNGGTLVIRDSVKA